MLDNLLYIYKKNNKVGKNNANVKIQNIFL